MDNPLTGEGSKRLRLRPPPGKHYHQCCLGRNFELDFRPLAKAEERLAAHAPQSPMAGAQLPLALPA